MSSVYKVAKYKDEEFWTGLRSEDPETRLATLCEARNAVIGLVAAKCYFIDHGIYSILEQCLPEHCDTESEVVSQLRLEATLFIGVLVQSIEHARRTVGKIRVASLTGQLSLSGRIVAASLTALHHLCIYGETRAEVALHGTDILLGMLRAECGVNGEASGRQAELLAKIIGCVAADWHPRKNDTRLSVLETLARLLEEKKARSPVVFACLECAVRILTSALPAFPKREDFAVLTILQINRLLPDDQLKLHMSDTFHPPIQVCAAQLLCYKLVVATSWQGSGESELPFRECIRRTLLPMLIREAVGGPRARFTLLNCHCLHVIRLLVRFFRADAGAIAFRCESFGRSLTEKLQHVFLGTADGGVGVAWHYATCALRCLTELCSLSEGECVQISQLPGIKDCIVSPMDPRCPSLSAKVASLELTLALSRSVQVCRSLLYESAAWKPAADVLFMYQVHLKSQSPMLVTACSILANMMLPFCSMRGVATKSGVLINCVCKLIVGLISSPSLDGPWRTELLREALAVLHNASFEVEADVNITVLDHVQSLLVMLDASREDFYPDVRLATVKLIAQLNFLAVQHHAPAACALRSLVSYLREVVESGECEHMYWTVMALRQLFSRGMFSMRVDVDWDILTSGIRGCLQHPWNDVKIQATLLINRLVASPYLNAGSRNSILSSLESQVGHVEPVVEPYIMASLEWLGV